MRKSFIDFPSSKRRLSNGIGVAAKRLENYRIQVILANFRNVSEMNDTFLDSEG